jgi:LysM repeat protein
MSQPLVFSLLGLALVLPIVGSLVLRMLARRLSPAQLHGSAALIFGVAIASVLVLASSDISSLQIGRLSLLLPAASAEDRDLAALVPTSPPDTLNPTALISPTAELAPSASATTTPQVTRTLTPTASPSATPAATQTATPSATALPPTATPTATPIPTAEPTAAPPTAAPAGPRTYTVQPGDTLGGIARQFGVSVPALIKANNLTPAQADSLRVGQKLVIP